MYVCKMMSYHYRFIEPNILVSIQPVRLNVLAYSPYNTFTLTCLVEEMQYLAIQPSVDWMLNGSELTKGNGYSINTSTLETMTIRQTLSYHNGTSVPGDYEYHCVVTLSLSNDTSDQLQFTSSAIVTIKG